MNDELQSGRDVRKTINIFCGSLAQRGERFSSSIEKNLQWPYTKPAKPLSEDFLEF